MSIFFISDLHLQENDTETTQQFVHFLQNQAIHAEKLYILGDLFEAWIGDDDHTPFNCFIIDQLLQLTKKNIPVYLMPGNRDFLLAETFSKMSGCSLVPDPFLTTVYQIPVLLSHGDKCCTKDYLQKWFRLLSGSSLGKTFFVHGLPLKMRRFMAKQIRSISKKYNRRKKQEDMDITENAVIDWMERHAVLYLIHGHTHRPEIHSIPLRHGIGTRISLGSWQNQGEILICNPSRRASLRFTLTSVKGLL